MRRSLYNLMDLILKSTAPDAGKAIGKSGNTFDGSGSFKGFVSALMPALLTKKEDGRIVKVYTGLADAADGYLAEGIRDAFADVLADTEKEYDRTYTDDARGHVLTLAEYAPAFRHLVFCVLEGTARSPYATEDAIRDACTFLRFARIALSKHYTEACLAYLRAAVKNAAGE